MNKEQTQGLVQIRNKFVSEHKSISEIEVGTVHTRLDTLTIEELKYLGNFPSVIKNSIIDLELTDDQITEDASPVFDLAAASKKALKLATVLDERFDRYYKAFEDELKSGFRLESIWESPRYKTIAKSAGLDKDTVTLEFLSTLDAKAEAKRIKEKLVGHFGFDQLAKMYKPGGPALKLNRLIEESDDMPEGSNPVLFEAIAAQIVDDYCMEKHGDHGFVKQGNVILKLTSPSVFSGSEIKTGEMVVLEIGINPKKFKLSNQSEESFPNVPGRPFKPAQFVNTKLADSKRVELKTLSQNGVKFLVDAEIYQSEAYYSADFGKTVIK
jgi:hypothetical protein